MAARVPCDPTLNFDGYPRKNSHNFAFRGKTAAWLRPAWVGHTHTHTPILQTVGALPPRVWACRRHSQCQCGCLKRTESDSGEQCGPPAHTASEGAGLRPGTETLKVAVLDGAGRSAAPSGDGAQECAATLARADGTTRTIPCTSIPFTSIPFTSNRHVAAGAHHGRAAGRQPLRVECARILIGPTGTGGVKVAASSRNGGKRQRRLTLIRLTLRRRTDRQQRGRPASAQGAAG